MQKGVNPDMKWNLSGLLVGLFAVNTAYAAVDCAQVRARYQCMASEYYPLHLSFDDGPALQTSDVLNVLKREKISATFFVIGEKIDCEKIQQTQCTQGETNCQALKECHDREQIMQRAAREGHTIGSHGYYHVRHSELDPNTMRQYVKMAMDVSEPFLNTNPPLFRLPYGDGWFNRDKQPQVLNALRDYGFQHLAWEMSSFDWDEKNQAGDKIISNVMEQMCSRRKGGTVLFHDGMDKSMHQGRVFTTQHLAEWIPIMRCVADFKPLSHFEPELRKR